MIQRTRTTETAAMRTPLLSRFLTIAFVLGLCLAAVLGVALSVVPLAAEAAQLGE